jgi:hypothetical protein
MTRTDEVTTTEPEVAVTRPTGWTVAGPALDILVTTPAVEGQSDVDRVVRPDAGRLFTAHD